MASEARPGPDWAGLGAIAVACLVAGILRFGDLGRLPLWSDEAFVVMARDKPWSELLTVPFDVHPPLFLAMQKLLAFLGDGDAATRLPAALCGVLTIPVVAALGHALGGRPAAVVAAFAIALSTAHLYFSQEARSYSLLVFLLALAALGAVRFLRTGRDDRRIPLLFAASAILALHTHLVAAFYVAGLSAGVLVASLSEPGRTRRSVAIWIAANVAVGLAWLPWLAVSARTAGAFGNIQPTSLAELAWHLTNVLGAPALPLGAAAKLLELLVAAAMLAGGLVLIAGRRHAGWPILGMMALAPVLMVLASLSTPIIETKTLLPLVVPGAVLAGVAVASIRGAAPRLAAAGLVLGITGASAVLAHGAFNKPNDPARVARALAEAPEDGAILLCLPFSAPALAREMPSRPIHFVELPPDAPPVAIRYGPKLWRMIYRLPYDQSLSLRWSRAWLDRIETEVGAETVHDAADFLSRHATVHHVSMTCGPERRAAFAQAMERAGWRRTATWRASEQTPPPVFGSADWSEIATFTRDP